MAEFRIHHDVDKLLNLLDVKENPNIGLTREQLAEQLKRSVDHPTKTRGAINTYLRKLDVQHNQELNDRYSTLKANNVPEVDPLVNLMARINEDRDVKHFLKWQNNLETRRLDRQEAVANHYSDPPAGSDLGQNTSIGSLNAAHHYGGGFTGSSSHFGRQISQSPTPSRTSNQNYYPPHYSSSHQHLNIHSKVHQANHSQQQYNTGANGGDSHATPVAGAQHQYHHQHHVGTNGGTNGNGANGGANGNANYGPASSSNTGGSNENVDVDQFEEHVRMSTATMSIKSGHKNRAAKGDRARKKESLQFRMRAFKGEHPFLSLDFQPIEAYPVAPLGHLSLLEQESCLINDLFFVLTGTDGEYIRMTPLPENPRKFGLVIDQSGDKLLHTLSSRIQRLCPIYSIIIHFVEDANNGLVNQALGGAMREILKDYLTLLAQLETQHRRGELTLQRMWFFIQPCFAQLEILKQIVDDISKGQCYGGATLSVLHQVTLNHSGDPKAQAFCLSITKHACEPYFEFLEKWIYQGLIDDIHKEFFIEDKEPPQHLIDEGIDHSDSYWDSRFIVNELKVPKFLDSLKLMILKTGKYLSVIRQCGKPIEQDFELEPLFYTTEERFYREKVESAYKYASQELLSLLINDSDLLGRFDSIKHYFLLDQGDFMIQFMDIAEDELEKDINDIVPSRLESLLELALRTSVLNSDPYNDDVHIELRDQALLQELNNIIRIDGNVPYNDVAYMPPSHHPPHPYHLGAPPVPPLIHGHAHSNSPTSTSSTSQFSSSSASSLKGFESIVFNYNVQWPLSLIITRHNIACYQMLFRHLFYCKYIERLLSSVWRVNKVAKCYPLHAVAGYAQAFALRQKMLNFVQNVLYYMMVELIEPAFHVFIYKVKNEIHNVDEMIKKHTEFVDDCLRDSMLTEGDLLSSMITILKLCTEFCSFMQNAHRQSTAFELQGASNDLVKAYEAYDSDHTQQIPDHTGVNGLIDSQTGMKLSFEERVTDMHKRFNDELFRLLHSIVIQSQDSTASSKLLHILYRLDFNGFYSKFMDDNSSSTVVQL